MTSCTCFWWDCFACDGGDEENCPLRISPKNELYGQFYNQYDTEVNEKMDQIHEKYAEYFKYYKLGQNSLND